MSDVSRGQENGAVLPSGGSGGASISPSAAPAYPPEDTIVTSLPEKLPAEVRLLLDEAQPLPPGVVFFEERITIAALAKRGLLGLALLAVGVLIVLFGLSMLFSVRHNTTVYSSNDGTWWVLAVGAVFCFAGWFMVSSIPAGLTLSRQQQAGKQTRYGLFLLPKAQVWRTYADTTVIPRTKFHHLENTTLHYVTKTGVKSFALPMEWIGVTPVKVVQAIAAWTAAGTSPGVPPTLPTLTATGRGPSAV